MVVLNEISKGASSSASTQSHRYDVYLSFRGSDTRLGFTYHLYNALMHANIATFLDDEEIETGEDLKPELESAIKASRASIIVLSKNYADSRWCLNELLLILERRRESNHIVIPIFYHVDPTHVRNQQDTFRDAMAKHINRMEAETNDHKRSKLAQKIEKWNNALTQVADLKGKDANGRLEVELIDEIVKDIFRRLHISSRFPLPQLIGMDYSIEFVTSWLNDASSHTDTLTIVGMGGIGKTSLAKYVFASHSHEFDTSSFIQDTNRRCDENYKGILDVQKQLYHDISRRSSAQVYDDSIYISMIENALGCKKAFLVLDDIGSLDQLDLLLGSKGFHLGSKIIITTRDAGLTDSCVLSKTNGNPKNATYNLKGLFEIESQKLLCFHAFMRNDPKEGYEEVSKELVKYCQGHPMALKVLGRSLHNRDVTYWEGYIERLKKENNSPINNVLKMSFDSLPSENDKELFKHIACIFVGTNRDVTVTILEACGIETRSGITNLTDTCLLSIKWNNELTMHQLVQEMGRFLVRKESLDKPWERSRLWGHESFKVLKQKKGTENILGLVIDMRMLEKEKLHGSLELKTDALTKMDRLMLLQLNYMQITDSYKNFPEDLRWLCMHGFPLKSLPSDMRMENLVALDMSYSNIETFGIWYSYPQRLQKRLKQLIGSCTKDEKLLGSLKILNLSFCKQLCSLGGFEHLPELERLIVRGCIGLVEVCESVGLCDELVLADLSYCNKIRKLSRIIGVLKKVKTLLLDGCTLSESTRIENRAGSIVIDTNMSSSTFVEAIPSDLKFFTIPLLRCLVELSLENNNLSDESFPMDFNCLYMLRKLSLDENPIISLPHCVRTLPRLETLTMNNCDMLTSLEHPPHTLSILCLNFRSDNPSLRKVVFDPEMALPQYLIGYRLFAYSSFEIEGVVKIEPMAGVEESVLCNLGWTKLNFLNKRRLQTYNIFVGEPVESEIQMYYEFGIFSTIYGGYEMPNWITDRSIGPSISFTIPSSPNNFKGLNFCYVQMPLCGDFVYLPLIKISNITKNHIWIYQHYIDIVSVGENCFTFLSHWMFRMDEMECGDNINVVVCQKPNLHPYLGSVTMECGVNIMYDNGDKDGEENALSYYESWNHIIGGDLIGFQLTTGEYILHTGNFIRRFIGVHGFYHGLVRDDANYKVSTKDKWFRALSQKKCVILGDADEVYS